MIPATTYQQGDIVVVQFPFTDMSQTKKRPALVISNNAVNRTGDYLMVQITSQAKEDEFSLLYADSCHFTTTSLPSVK